MKFGLVLCLVLLVSPNAGAKDVAVKKELESVAGHWIQGELIFLEPAPEVWTMIYGRTLSVKNPTELFTNRAGLLIAGNRFTFKNGDHTKSVIVEIDPTKPLKTIDFVLDENKKLLGVYEITNGQLYLNIGNGKTRPERILILEGDKGRLRIGFSKQRS